LYKDIFIHLTNIILETNQFLSYDITMGAPTNHYQPYAKQHEDPQGPGDARPTGLQIIEDNGLVNKLSDKVMIITGCTAGLGIETARSLHATGAKLFLTVRNKEKGEAVIQDILKTSQGKGSIELILMDLSSLSSVRSAAADFLSRSDQLSVLINNAGIILSAEATTADGFEMAMGTNHFGHFLFFQLLKPTLLKSSTSSFQSRVVNVASSAHRISPIRFHDMDFAKEGRNGWVAYGQSKTANIYMANSIERHYGAKGLHAFSLHPGTSFGTDGMRHATEEEYAALGEREIYEKVEKSVVQGAATSVWAAVATYLEGKGGIYLSDVGEAKPAGETELVGGPGYGPGAYDEAAEEKLWELSYKAVGLPVED
jgi:NAD(P)-dependent dehydrogenase (short-subunit alcohol dehydrogenase family)